MPTLFIGVDLGGSGTRAALVDADGDVLATGRGPSGLLGRVSARTAASRRLLARALDAALAPIAPRVGDDACVVFAGVRGLSLPGRREALVVELQTRFVNATVHVSNDALIGLWGGLAGQPGVAVVAGSGSIALARSADGREGRAGGWGYLLGDEGSGFWIGREAVASYLRTLEGRQPAGRLAALIAQAVRRDSVPGVLGWLYAGEDQVARLGELAPLVSQAAAGGDPAAMRILDRAGRALAEVAAAAACQIWPDKLPGELVVSACGGVWTAGEALTRVFDARLAEVLPGARRSAPRLPPVGGAVLLAMSADQRPLPAAVIERVCAGLGHL